MARLGVKSKRRRELGERGGWAYKKQENEIYFTLVVHVQLTCLTSSLILCLATGMSQGPDLAPFFRKNLGLGTSLVIIAQESHD
jgi:hypothetical protein